MILTVLLLVASITPFANVYGQNPPDPPFVKRFEHNPIVDPYEHAEESGPNANGPSLVRVPDWVENPLGKYYLYFGHHEGLYIRMVYADELVDGATWRTYADRRGVLHVDEFTNLCVEHVSSPEVRIDEENQQFVMYIHCPLSFRQGTCGHTFALVSKDGLNFQLHSRQDLGISYFRVFEYEEWFYAITYSDSPMYRSRDGLVDFEVGATPFTFAHRHFATLVEGDTLFVFYSLIGSAPETIMMSTMDLRGDWLDWRPSIGVTVITPEFDYEGVNEPIVPSESGVSFRPVHELRDPDVFVDIDGRYYLLYSVAGEFGIGISEMAFNLTYSYV